MTQKDPPPAGRVELDAPMAPLAERALEWLVFLHSGEETDADWAAYEAWRSTGPAEQRAAEQAETLWAGLGPALRRPRPGLTRRSVLSGACLALAGGSGLAAGRLGISGGPFADERTGIGERRALTLPDGTRIELDAATSFDLDYSPQIRRITLLEGRIFVEVARDPARPFVVDAGSGTVQALGTAFELSLTRNFVQVVVNAHKVRVRFPRDGNAASQVDVGAGHEVTYGPAAGLGRPAPADLAERMAWRYGQLAFQDRPLREVVDQLSRYRRGRIVVLGEDLAELKVSGLFESADSDGLLDALAMALPVTIDRLPWLTLIRRDAARPLSPFLRHR